MKICTRCFQKKDLTEFYKKTERKDGHRAECKICTKKYQKEYNKTEQGKETHRRNALCYYVRHPEFIKAKNAVNNTITAGKFPRLDSLQCNYCPVQAKQYHHYKGYAPEHWFDVIPVCIPCHKKCHRKIA